MVFLGSEDLRKLEGLGVSLSFIGFEASFESLPYVSSGRWLLLLTTTAPPPQNLCLEHGGGGSLAGSPAFTLVLTPPRKQRTISKLHLQFWGCAYLSILGPCESSSVPSVPRPTPHRRLKKSSSALHIPTSATDVIPALWMHDCLPLLTMLCFFFLHIMEGRLRHFYPPSLTWVG